MAQQNLISGTLTDPNRDTVLAAIETIRSKMPFLVSLSEG